MKIKKIISKIHLWLGLASGIIVIIVSITGCIYVFEHELRTYFYADRIYNTSQTNKKISLNEVVKIAKLSLGNKYEPERMHIPKAEGENIFVQFRGYAPKTESNLFYWEGMKYYFKVYINPYNGEIEGVENTKWEFFNIIMWLHFSLLLDYSIGHTIVGYTVLVFVVMLISGLVLWWPKKNKKARRQRFWFRWKSTTKWKKKNFDLHNILGFYSSIFALIIAVTGLFWAFDWMADGIKWLARGGKTIEHTREEYKLSPKSERTAFDLIINQINNEAPTAESFYIRFPKKEGLPLMASAILRSDGGYGNSISYQFDPNSGKKFKRENFSDLNTDQKVKALIYPIHVGSILGLPGKILAFIISLICASLPITGFLFWLGRTRKKKEKNPIKTKNSNIKISKKSSLNILKKEKTN